MEKLTDKTNAIYGAIAAVGTAFLGQYWFLFAGFLFLNVIDYVTGYVKAKYFLKNESSKIGAKGIFKKVLYWIIIAISFFVSNVFVGLGKLIDINLGFMVFLGWFTLASYLINEIRSITENAVQMGGNVPTWLIKGLAVANDSLNKMADSKIPNESEEKNK